MNQGRLPGDRVVQVPRADKPREARAGWYRQKDGRVLELGTGRAPSLIRYGASALALVLVTALMIPLREHADLLNIGLVYLVVVILVTILAGQLAGILASVLGFFLFNYYYVPPYHTLAVNELRNILSLVVFLGVSLLLSWLIAGAREQAMQAQRRAEDVSRLYELSQAIIGAQRMEDVLPAIAEKVRSVFDAEACWVLLPDKLQQLAVRSQSPANAEPLIREEIAAAEWAFANGQPIEHARSSGLRDRQRARRVVCAPLHAGAGVVGVLAVGRQSNRPLTVAERTVFATFADQTAVALERLRLLAEAQRAETLARTDELKSALVSAVSHDLRTPLASIVASVTSLMEPGVQWDEETRRDFLQGIYEEAQRLNRLVGNLLDMSRIEGGALHPERDWYSIEEVVQAVADRLEPRLQDRPLSVNIAPGIPLLRLDFSQIDQVLTNLVENAIRYTPPGTPITISAEKTDDSVEVSVEDRGPGVPAEHLPHLFDKFYRVERSDRRSPGGTGLGLAISKGMVEANGGHIRARNRPEGGLVVTFSLPIPHEAHALTAATPQP
jgi:two-component system, OmpR family, sensor histidine kinase KdpD